MSILSSLYSAAAGLNAHGSALGVVSDNIANVSTFGFKSGRAQFEDVLGSTVASATLASVGRGARMAGVQRVYTQGSLLATGKSTDLAIQGDGFFTLSGNHQGVEGEFFSRAGMFHLNNQGRLENPQGLLVQGYVATAQGDLGTKLQGFFIPPNAAVPARATEEVDLAANVDSVDDVVTLPFTADEADTRSNFSTSVTVYDSLGMGHTIDVYFRKQQNFDEVDTNDPPGADDDINMAWSWHAVVDGGEVTQDGGIEGEPFEVANGVLTFAASGELMQEYTIQEAIDDGVLSGVTLPNQVSSRDSLGIEGTSGNYW
ncbi:MAG: flagellar hook-basal body complex protein, partial [Myxococcota bacterium]|nr:flagellar hook-basal body complex protein [Myxococcota bacterium]